MTCHRLHGLRIPVWVTALVMLSVAIPEHAFAANQAAQQNPPATQQDAGSGNQTPPAQKPPQGQQNNPFENVPEAPEKNQPAPTPSGTQEAHPATVNENIVEEIDFRGSRRVPQDTLKALIFTKRGDVFDPESVHRDFMALWNSGRFDDLRVEKDRGPHGGIVLRFVVTERRVVHTIDYTGAKSISKSEILDRFKDRKLALSPESQFDPGKVQRAKNILLEYEAERGHQYATVTPQIRQVPPGGVDINFAIDEGPKVKVGHIEIEGNNVFSDQVVIRAMKNLKPIGIPHSWLFENIFARTYDSTKLDEDSERIRQYYQSKGYFMARVIDHTERVYDQPPGWLHFPFTHPKPGKRVDITMKVNEGDKYTLRNFQFSGMKLFRTPDLIARQVFGMGPGDVFSTEKLQKGMDNLRKLYGDFGYLDFVPSPDPEPVPGKPQIDLTIDVDEGHQFFVRRIDFQGNNTTRDRVIRREIMIDEGDLYSQRLWDTSILRLNQLGFFEPLKAEDATTITRDTKTNTVDLLLKVKERGKNSIQLNGGVSGISGSFIGFTYSTNNFLGLGETLSLNSQLGTLISSVSLGFTEPYLFNKPIQAGFTVFYQEYRYNQGQQESLIYGQNLISYFQQVGSYGCPTTSPGCNLLNYTQNGRGFTTFASYQLRRSFARLGLSYSYSDTDIKPLTDAATTYFQEINYLGLNGNGANQLTGIKTSMISPTLSYNTVNHPIIPTKGLRASLSFGFAGSFLGGNVNTLQPNLDIAYFRKGLFKGNVMGFHFAGRMITGYGGKGIPPYTRYYMGGENDVRGFDIYSISPFGFSPGTQSVTSYYELPPNEINNSYYYSTATPKPCLACASGVQSVNVPAYQVEFPGGDTYGVFNYEYRIPIFGPVTLAPFLDVGVDRISFPSQLSLNPDAVNSLNASFNYLTNFNGRVLIAPGTQKPRVSTGLELQVLMPVVNAPFRLYYAYNLSYVDTNLHVPAAFSIYDPFAATNETTLRIAAAALGQAIPWDERHSLFRFSVGRTF